MEEEDSIFKLYLGFCRRNAKIDPPKSRRYMICWDESELHLYLLRYKDGNWLRFDNGIIINVTHWADPSAFQITQIGSVEKTYDTWVRDWKKDDRVKCIDNVIGDDVPVCQGIYTIENINANGIVLKEFIGKGTYPYRYFSKIYPEKDYTCTSSDVSI